jgi:hypothetical protein
MSFPPAEAATWVIAEVDSGLEIRDPEGTSSRRSSGARMARRTASRERVRWSWPIGLRGSRCLYGSRPQARLS